MKIFKIVLLFTLIIGLQAKDIKWNTLESLEEYSYLPETNFHLKDNVQLLKIVWEENGKRHRMNIWRKSDRVMNKKKSKQFHKLKPKYSPKVNMRNSGNAFFIDQNGKFWQMDMIEDVIMLLGDIDTPAEAQLVLWLYEDRNAIKYSKTSNGYKLLAEKYKGKKCYLDEVFISTKGKFSSKRLTRGCQKIAKKKMVKNKYIKYERFTDIVIDKKENIYLLGKANDTRSNNNEVVTIDKYNRNGKKIWQEIMRDGYVASAEKLALDDRYLYFIDTSSRYDFILQYSIDGKVISSKAFEGNDKKHFEAIHQRSNTNTIKQAPYYRDRSGHEILFNKQVRSESGNIYAIGSENIYHEAKDVLPGECGVGESENGALIVKFDKRGDQVWSKVIDLKW